MVEKDKDLFLDMLENPNLSLEDLVSVGHSAESTRFLDKSMYENSQRVRDKFTDSEGNFKQDEFDKWYALAADSYQKITDKDTNLSLLNVTAFNESDIAVSPEKRTLNTKPIVSFSPNPDRLSTSIFRIGKTSERERSLSELALAEKILLNPVEAAKDPSKARWGDSPNDSWWGNFFDTLVLAQWDEDGVHIDPVTKQQTLHKKGDLKLNENGTYYYEALDGRDIYGRLVLNKFDTITTDGTFWNQYDFFDSDDIKEKSFVGSVAKNLALVGSMFIPYVGWGIAGASVATQMVGLAGTFGKMLTGSDSPTLSAMEGWSKSLSRSGSKSEYAQQNMLCWENFIDLIGDTAAQLRELRAIFKFAPAAFGKGKYGIGSKHFGMNAETLTKLEKDVAKKALDESKVNLGGILEKTGGDIIAAKARLTSATNNVISNIADKAVKNYFENYNKLGEQIARAYMVGITVSDTYGEAKEAGASDFEAAMLTIGYAAAENKLLSSELGRWIFPELKAERATMAQIAKKALELPENLAAGSIESTLKSSGFKAAKAELIGKGLQELPQNVRKAGEALGKLDKNSRLAWMKTLFNKGKDIFNTLNSVMKGTLGAAISNALAEGTEEVSEELLKDFSTSCFNIVKAAQGNKDVRMQGFLGEWDWNQALKRYGMSFFGGAIGGGINSAATDYSQFRDIANMTSDRAMQLLVWMDRNNEMDKFWDVIDKTTLGDKLHTSERDENGNFKLGDANNNQDLEIKKALRNLVDLIHNILTANGASIDDEGVIGQIMNALPAAKDQDLLGDFRANALATSVTAGRFLKEYNNLCKAIAIQSVYLLGLVNQTTDSKAVPEDLQLKITLARSSLNTLLSAKDKLLQGERSAEFYRDALFETTYGVSESFLAPTEVQFMERETGKDYSLLSDKEKDELKVKYADWSKSERSEQIHQLADIFYGVTGKTSLALLNSSEVYQQIKDGQLKKFQLVTNISMNKLHNLMRALNDEQAPIEKATQIITDLILPTASPVNLMPTPEGTLQLQDGSVSELQRLLGTNSELFKTDYETISGNATLTAEQKIPLLIGSFIENLSLGLTDTAEEVIKAGYIHPEVKANLLPVLKLTADYCDELLTRLDNIEGLSEEDETKIAETMLTLEDLQENLDLYTSLIQELNYTPISENLRTFAIGLGTDLSVLDLIEFAIDSEKDSSGSTALDLILLDEKKIKQFEEADKILKLYRASIIAARNDNADLDHIFGYNKVLNELCKSTDGWIPLAEIDADTAQLALQDVNMAINRLDFIKEVNSLNRGNKLNLQHLTAANKNYILFNKTKKLITSLLNEDDPDAKEVQELWGKDALNELNTALEGMVTHKQLTGDEVALRTLTLTSELRMEIEKELHAMDDAIYNFFQKNLDKLTGSKKATEALAKLIKVAGFDLYSRNEDLLTEQSKDIDDGSFVWWLAGKAALKSSDFHKKYKEIISDDIAPIPTLELGIFSAIAAISNGDVFSAFGKALKHHIKTDWSGKSPELRVEIINKKNLKVKHGKNSYDMLPTAEENLKDVNQSELVPNYSNILFIEGIPGSGKSTGVFKSIVKMLLTMNPIIDGETKLLSKPIIVAHSTKENADSLAESLKFPDGTPVQTYGKEELLKLASLDYKNRKNPDSGKYEYVMGEDCVEMPDGSIHSTWKVNPSIPKDQIPAVIFIDEWSRYTLPEVDLLSRFASEYGIQIIAGGDMDLLSPTAYLLAKPTSKIEDDDTIEMSISRNITARVPKLGVSMRTGNGLKTENLLKLQVYLRNPSTKAVILNYVETDTDLFGDKVYLVGDSGISNDQLTAMLQDIDKMIANLEEGEKIGYIYHDKESNLYKLLSSDKYKDKIDPKSEDDAQGLEANYYIVENNRSKSLLLEDYLKSLYTGISRSSKASIVIAPSTGIENFIVKSPAKPDTELIPDSFTGAGITRFSKERKSILEKLYPESTSLEFNFKSRKKERIDITKQGAAPGDAVEKVDTEGKSSEDAADGNSEGTPEEKNPGGESSEGEEANPEEESGEAESTVWENNPENFKKVINTIVATALDAGAGMSLFNIKELERVLNTQPNDLITIIADLANTGIINKLSGDIYSISLNNLNKLNLAVNNLLPKEEPKQPTINEYKKGDLFTLNDGAHKGTYTVLDVIYNPDTDLYSYTLNKGFDLVSYSEEALKQLEAEGKHNKKEDCETPEGGYKQPELPSASFSLEELLQILEDDAAKAQSLEEEVKLTKDDIDFRILGYTWNTNYLGVDFDLDGRPILPLEGEPGSRRIDQANGLLKLNPAFYDENDSSATQTNLRKVIGTIRKAMMYKTNEEIVELLAGKNGNVGLIPSLQGLDLKIHWAFISKAAEHHTGDGGRFFYDPKYKLDNMEDDEHSDIPLKMVSMLVEDLNGNCILEMPLLTLGSPFTALYLLGKKLDEQAVKNGTPMNNSIILKYRSIVDNPDLSLEEIMAQMVEAIDNSPEAKTAKGRLKSGYSKLRDICKLWLFTSDGIRLLDNVNKTAANKRGDKFSLSQHTQNLGVHFIKDRITELTIRGEIGPYDYTLVWHDLKDEAERSDVNYSDIMMATDAYDMHGNKIVAAGHPFILRSDSDAFITTEDMMRLYLRQLADPSLPKIIKLEILTPPEMSVEEWLDERTKGEFCHYGNEFSAYRVLSLIKRLARSETPDPVAKELWEKLDLKNTLAPIIDAMDRVQEELAPLAEENHQEYLSRVYRKQKDIMTKNGGASVFSSPLFDLTHTGLATDLGIRGRIDDNINKIVQVCSYTNPKTGKPYITGILYRPVCKKDEEAVYGYALRIQTGHNRFTNPDGKSFRIYSRYDSPSFDLSDKLSGMIHSWADKAYKGFDSENPNIWHFVDYKKDKKGNYILDANNLRIPVRERFDYAFNLYNAEGKTSKPKVKKANQWLLEIPKNALDILEENDYNSLENITDKTRFLEFILKKFIAIPGNVAVIVNGDQLITSLLNDLGKINSENIPDEYKDAKQVYPDGFIPSGNGDNSYTLKVETAEGIKEVGVTIIPNESEIQFEFELNNVVNEQPLGAFDFTAGKAGIQDYISRLNPDRQKALVDLFNEILAMIPDLGDKQLIARAILQKYSGIKGWGVIRAKLLSPQFLGPDFFENVNLNEDTNQDDNQNETCSFTIVRKKF